MIDALREVMAAKERLRPYVHTTPVRRSSSFSRAAGCEVFLKLENLQVTGSFKVRGAFNKLLPLQKTTQRVVAASTGNHALAVAHACTTLGLTCALYVPTSINRHKVAALRRFGTALCFVDGDAVKAEYAAHRVAQVHGRTFVSPYNDPAVIGGQGTVGTELLTQAPALDYVFVAVGGGGLISGIASVFKAYSRHTRIIGCSPAASPVMHESVRSGRIVTLPARPTLSDGTAGGIEDTAITFALCRNLVDDWLLVSEHQIRHAMQFLHDHESLTVEGAAGVAAAALLNHAPRFLGSRVAIVLCGGNVSQGLADEPWHLHDHRPF